MAGIDANTTLLLHFDEEPFVDSSQYGGSITNTGSVTRTAAASKFGGYASGWSNTNQYLTIPTVTFNSNFTIDFWVNQDVTQSQNSGHLFQQGLHTTGSNFFEIIANTSDNTFRVNLYKSGSYDVYLTTDPFPAGQWNHFAVEGYNNTIYTYINGVMAGSEGYSPSNMPVGTTTWIGRSYYSSPPQSFYYKGQMDEFRISDVARYQGQNFTPETRAYGDKPRGVFSIIFKKSSPIDENNRTSDFYWGPDTEGTYNAGSWEAENEGGYYRIKLDAFLGTDGGAWTDGYQPIKVKFTFTGTIVDTYISNSNGSNTIPIENIESGVYYSLSGLFNDSEDYIDRIEFHTISTSGSFTVTAIEFSFV